MAEHASWELEPGDEIAPGRTVLQRIGGGNRYEVYLVWDDELWAIMVAKILRPDRVDDEDARAGMRREAEALDALAHPVLLRGFGAHSRASTRTCSSSTSKGRRCARSSAATRRCRSSRPCR